MCALFTRLCKALSKKKVVGKYEMNVEFPVASFEFVFIKISGTPVL